MSESSILLLGVVVLVLAPVAEPVLVVAPVVVQVAVLE